MLFVCTIIINYIHISIQIMSWSIVQLQLNQQQQQSQYQLPPPPIPALPIVIINHHNTNHQNGNTQPSSENYYRNNSMNKHHSILLSKEKENRNVDDTIALQPPPPPPPLKQQQQQSKVSQLQLRFNWTNLQRYSSIAQQISDMQSKCTNQIGYYWSRNKSGLGSDLHYYSIALCNALQQQYQRHYQQHQQEQQITSSTTKLNIGNDNNVVRGVRVMSLLPWTWYSTNDCPNSNHSTMSAMKCYFPESEPDCDDDTFTNTGNDSVDNIVTVTQPSRVLRSVSSLSSISSSSSYVPPSSDDAFNMTRRQGGMQQNCSTVIEMAGNVSVFRAASTEFLFTRVSNLVQQEGQRQLNLVFNRRDLNRNSNNIKKNTTIGVPKNLITVHIRWGDKGKEMKLSSIYKYIAAIEEILRKRRTRMSKNQHVPTYKDTGYTILLDTNTDIEIETIDHDEVNIFLATEDPEALDEFQKAAPKVWNIYIDQYYIENLEYRNNIGNIYNVNTMVAAQYNGKTGLLALGSLLVAMEANDYVLTTGSNWSRLINELRLNVLNPRCDHCTTMIDLCKGES
jgi:hypothetical protein